MSDKNQKVIKPITLKANAEDKLYLDQLALNKQCTIADAFALVIDHSRTVLDFDKKQLSLQHEINELTLKQDELQKSNAEIQHQLETAKAKEIELLKQIEELKNQPPKQVEVTKEVIKEVEKPLTGHQFICEIEESTALLARKLRKFVAQDGHVKTTGENYPNELANVSIKYFLSRKYDDLIK